MHFQRDAFYDKAFRKQRNATDRQSAQVPEVHTSFNCKLRGTMVIHCLHSLNSFRPASIF